MPRDENEQSTSLTVSSQKHIGVNFTTAEMALSLDDFADRILAPRVSQLAAAVDADVANAYKSIYNSVGTPGTTPATSLVLLQAQQKLNEGAVPMNPRYATVNPAANAGLVEGMKGLFNPSATIGSQFKSGMMGEGVLGYNEIAMSQSIKSISTGTRTNGAVTDTAVTEGSSTIEVDGLGADATIAAGEVFTIASVYAVNPQTRESTGSLQQFVVTAAATASVGGVAELSVSPAFYPADSATDANVALATINDMPAEDDVVTFVGSASAQYPQNLIYHKDAITMATADLLLPQGVDMASRQVHNGISLRIVRQYDISTDKMPCRIDVLYGYGVIRPEAAVRMWG